MLNDRAWVSCHKTGAAPKDYQAFHYLEKASGTLLYDGKGKWTGALPAAPGEYEMRLYSADKTPLTDYFVMSVPFTVTGGG